MNKIISLLAVTISIALTASELPSRKLTVNTKRTISAASASSSSSSSLNSNSIAASPTEKLLDIVTTIKVLQNIITSYLTWEPVTGILDPQVLLRTINFSPDAKYENMTVTTESHDKVAAIIEKQKQENAVLAATYAYQVGFGKMPFERVYTPHELPMREQRSNQDSAIDGAQSYPFRLIQRPRIHAIKKIVFSADHQIIAVWHSNGDYSKQIHEITVYNCAAAADKRVIAHFYADPHWWNIYRVALSPDGKKLAFAQLGYYIKYDSVSTLDVYEIPSCNVISHVDREKDYIHACEFSLDGKFLFTVGTFGGTMYDLTKENNYPQLDNFSNAAQEPIAFSADGTYFASFAVPIKLSKCLRIWNLKTGKHEDISQEESFFNKSLQISPNGVYVALFDAEQHDAHAHKFWKNQALEIELAQVQNNTHEPAAKRQKTSK